MNNEEAAELTKENEEAEAIRQLRHFIQMTVDDPSKAKRIKVSYTGQSFFGDFYILPSTLQGALK